MAYRIPTTQENYERNLSNYESELNQTSPLVDKAFLRVQSANEAQAQTELSRLAVDRARENLIITASESGLTVFGNEYNVPRKAGTATNHTIFLPATVGTSIPAGKEFVGDSNNVRYTNDSTTVAATDPTLGDGALMTVTAKDVGTAGNLNDGDTMTMDSPIAGATNSATVQGDPNTFGTDQEGIEAWRRRLLNEARTVGGGSNAVDYRTWAELGDGVFRAFPYSGRPSGTSIPGDRTVYIEVDSSINPDGEATGTIGQAVLDSARDNINYNQTDGTANPALGTTDSSLYVESITRVPFFVEIRNFSADPTVKDAAKTNIQTSLDEYFRAIFMWIEGLDPLSEKNDIITDLSVSTVVQDAMSPYGATADGVGFGLEVGVFISQYTLFAGELAKLETGGIAYA